MPQIDIYGQGNRNSQNQSLIDALKNLQTSYQQEQWDAEQAGGGVYIGDEAQSQLNDKYMSQLAKQYGWTPEQTRGVNPSLLADVMQYNGVNDPLQAMKFIQDYTSGQPAGVATAGAGNRDGIANALANGLSVDDARNFASDYQASHNNGAINGAIKAGVGTLFAMAGAGAMGYGPAAEGAGAIGGSGAGATTSAVTGGGGATGTSLGLLDAGGTAAGGGSGLLAGGGAAGGGGLSASTLGAEGYGLTGAGAPAGLSASASSSAVPGAALTSGGSGLASMGGGTGLTSGGVGAMSGSSLPSWLQTAADYVGGVQNLATIAGGLLGGAAGGDTTTSSNRDPWGPAQQYLRNNLQTNANMQQHYQANPFSDLQKQQYQNLFNTINTNQLGGGGLLANASRFQQSSRGQMPAMQQYGTGANAPNIDWNQYANIGLIGG